MSQRINNNACRQKQTYSECMDCCDSKHTDDEYNLVTCYNDCDDWFYPSNTEDKNNKLGQQSGGTVNPAIGKKLYNGRNYKVRIGSRGGLYIMVNKKRKYLSK
jgi:hypothetical protein